MPGSSRIVAEADKGERQQEKPRQHRQPDEVGHGQLFLSWSEIEVVAGYREQPEQGRPFESQSEP